VTYRAVSPGLPEFAVAPVDAHGHADARRR
jgi:hypothetical protein